MLLLILLSFLLFDFATCYVCNTADVNDGTTANVLCYNNANCDTSGQTTTMFTEDGCTNPFGSSSYVCPLSTGVPGCHSTTTHTLITICSSVNALCYSDASCTTGETTTTETQCVDGNGYRSHKCADGPNGCYDNGAAQGDPHINAFGGGHFDFIGMPNKIFNFISDEYFSLNILLVQVGLEKYKQFTYIGDIGIVVGEDKLLIPAVKEDVFYLNDVEYKFSDKNDFKLVGDCGIVGDHRFIIHGYELYFEKTDKTKHNINTTLHFNIKIVYDEEGRRETKGLPHGVVGQTADMIPRNETYNIEGKETDYLIESDDIFDTKFKYSKYKGKGCSEEMKNKIDNLFEKRNNNDRYIGRGMISTYSIIDDSYNN